MQSDSLSTTYNTLVKQRRSNLELYRIICMLLIVAHHFTGNFGVLGEDGPVTDNPLSANSIFLYLFGMWGKTGINCFVLITGYFMCTSNITVKKFLKLYLWIFTYRFLITVGAIVTGYQSLSPKVLLVFFPITSIHSDSFSNAFLVWWLFIPFLNILINNINRKQHLILLMLLVLCFSVYPSFPYIFNLQGLNPICWFSTLYIIASYIRKYPENIYKSDSSAFWGIVTLFVFLISMASVLMILWVNVKNNTSLPRYFFVSDSNKIMALLVAVSSFMWFNNIKIRYCKLINIIGGSTFGVFLFHTTSAMRYLIWVKIFHCGDYYDMPTLRMIGSCITVVMVVFAMGIFVDRIRIRFMEKPFFAWLERKKIKYLV